MSEPETIEGQVEEELSQALVHVPAPPPPSTLFGTDEPELVVRKAAAVATTLAQVLKDQKLTTKIGKGEHVRVEGWTLLGTMLGVYPVCEWTRPISGGWEARVVAVTRDGATVGAAEAECLRSESKWADRDDYMLRSMAQTRATSKALRQPLGFVVSLAGFDPTPAEEMSGVREQGAKTRPAGGVTGSTPADYDSRETITSWAELSEAVKEYGELTLAEFNYFGSQAKDYLHPEGGELSTKDKDALWKASVKAAVYLREHVDPDKFPPPTRTDLREAWKIALDMDEDLEGPPWRMGPDEEERPTYHEHVQKAETA